VKLTAADPLLGLAIGIWKMKTQLEPDWLWRLTLAPENVVLPETLATPKSSVAVIVIVEDEEPHVHVCP
jgi:hypothetical protein